MTGETELRALLANMSPRLSEENFVFCTLPQEELGRLELQPVATFQEEEGISLITSKGEADAAGLAYTAEWKMITLEVQSSLEAVGFLAVLTGRLAQEQISVNAVSAFFHDYLFVPPERAQDALRILRALMHKHA